MKLNKLLLFISFMSAGSLFIWAEDCSEGAFKYTADDGCGYKQEVIDFSYTTDPAACPTLGAYYLGPCEYHNGSTTGGDSGWWYDAYEAQCEESW